MPDGIHREKVVSVTQLEFHHFHRRLKNKFRLLVTRDSSKQNCRKVPQSQQHNVGMASARCTETTTHGQVCEVLLLVLGTLLEDLLQQQRVLSHPLYRLEQVARQIHPVTQADLLLLQKSHQFNCVPAFVDGRCTVACNTRSHRMNCRDTQDIVLKSSNPKRKWSLTLKNLAPHSVINSSDFGLFLLYSAYK